MRCLRCLVLPAFAVLFAIAPSTHPASGRPYRSSFVPNDARSILDSSLTRLGGRDALERIRRARFDQLVQWLTIRFDDQPHADAPLYNWTSDLRDYTINARRVTRRVSAGLASGGSWPGAVQVTTDSAAIQTPLLGGASTPLHVVYIDEQREEFATAPERVLLGLSHAPDLRLGTDTVIAGQRFVRLSGTLSMVSERPVQLFIDASDGTPAILRYRRAQPNDAQLGPLGEMDVEVWWTRWQRVALDSTRGVLYPVQIDVNRVGRPFQRITNMATNFNVPATPDSFVIADSLQRAFRSGPTARAMWLATPVDSATIVADAFATLPRSGTPVFATRVGSAWLLLEGAPTPTARHQQVEWLVRHPDGARVGAGVVTIAGGIGAGAGVGSGWLADHGTPVFIAPGARRAVETIGANWGDRSYGRVVTTGTWIHLGGDSAWVEPIDFPRAKGSLAVYVPSHQWIYSGFATSPAQVDALLALARRHGWTVTTTGSQLRATVPVPAAPPAQSSTVRPSQQ